MSIIILAKVFSFPVKIIFKLLLNVIIGIVILLCINYFGANHGITIPFNEITALVCGLLGIPGVILLTIIALIF
ncbi:MAG: pro-sigmaK processing inhibitor BofA family protein [Clostridia bacterium]